MILLVRLLVCSQGANNETSLSWDPQNGVWVWLSQRRGRNQWFACTPWDDPPPRNHVPSPLVLLCLVISHRWTHWGKDEESLRKPSNSQRNKGGPGKQHRWWVATWCCLMLSMVTAVIGCHTLDQSYPIRTTCCLKKVIETTAWPLSVTPTGVSFIALDGKRKPIHAQPILDLAASA